MIVIGGGVWQHLYWLFDGGMHMTIYTLALSAIIWAPIVCAVCRIMGWL